MGNKRVGIDDAIDSVWGSGRNKWKRFPAEIGEESHSSERVVYRDRGNKPLHIVHERYEDYHKRKHSGDFLLYIFGGALMSMIGLILWSFAYGILDRLFSVLLFLGGIYIMYRVAIPRRR